MNAEHEFQQYVIAAGVEAAAPEYGTTVSHLKAWMRQEAMIDPSVLNRWINRPKTPPSRSAPPPPPEPSTSMVPNVTSKLASRVLSDPHVRAQLARDGLVAELPVDEGDQPLSALLPPPASDDIPLDLGLDLLEPPDSRAQCMARVRPSVEVEPFVVDTEGRYSIYPARLETSVTICMPTIRDFSPQVLFGIVMLIRKYEIGFELQADTLLIRARNLIANRFLKSHAEWALWLDSDMLIPYGDPDWFAKKSRLNRLTIQQHGFDVVERLLAHRYPFVGGVYAARTANSQMVIQPDIDPRHPGDQALAEQIRGGVIRGLVNVDWLGFGCALIHRRVFEAVAKARAGGRPGEVDFFSSEGLKGEDVAFCERASAAGYQPKLDTELVLGHVGRMCFGPQHTVSWNGRR